MATAGRTVDYVRLADVAAVLGNLIPEEEVRTVIPGLRDRGHVLVLPGDLAEYTLEIETALGEGVTDELAEVVRDLKAAAFDLVDELTKGSPSESTAGKWERWKEALTALENLLGALNAPPSLVEDVREMLVVLDLAVEWQRQPGQLRQVITELDKMVAEIRRLVSGFQKELEEACEEGRETAEAAVEADTEGDLDDVLRCLAGYQLTGPVTLPDGTVAQGTFAIPADWVCVDALPSYLRAAIERGIHHKA